jgi:predicted ABC-type exoprotein transport system permease subunit
MRPQPNPRATWASSDDNGGFFLLVIVIGLGVLGYVAWLNYHATISTAVMAFFRSACSASSRTGSTSRTSR